MSDHTDIKAHDAKNTGSAVNNPAGTIISSRNASSDGRKPSGTSSASKKRTAPSGQSSKRAVSARSAKSKSAAPKPSRPAKPRTKKKKPLALRIVSAFLVLAIIGGGAVYAAKNYEKLLSVLGLKDDFSAGQADNVKFSVLSTKEVLYDNIDSSILLGDTSAINILLFGLDKSESREGKWTVFRPDTIMVLSINFNTKQITILSIPRDTYVNINGSTGKDKINSCFAYASWREKFSNQEELYDHGVRYLKNTVSALLGGININYYIGLDMDTAAKIINEIGGVYVEMDQESIYFHRKYLFPGGHRVYNGREFMWLARIRDYPNGDVDRTKVQQKLLKALFAQLKQTKISKIPKLIELAYKSVKTNIDIKTAVSFSLSVMEFDHSSIDTETFPGMFGSRNGISYWIVNQAKRVKIVKQLYGITTPLLPQDPQTDDIPVDPDAEGNEGENGGNTGEDTGEDTGGENGGDTGGDTGGEYSSGGEGGN